MHGRYNSFLGHDAFLIPMKYNFNLHDICIGEVKARCVVDMFINSHIEECKVQTACFLRKLILLGLRDNAVD